MKIGIFAQGSFGKDVIERLNKSHEIVYVFCHEDLKIDGICAELGIKTHRNMKSMLEYELDLIVTVQSYEIIPEVVLKTSALGGIGYHPSLLPYHKGKDAIKWTILKGDKITGGTVYWLEEEIDEGDIAMQTHVFVHPEDTPQSLWKDKLAPLGVDLIWTVCSYLDKPEDRVRNLRRFRKPQAQGVGSYEIPISKFFG